MLHSSTAETIIEDTVFKKIANATTGKELDSILREELSDSYTRYATAEVAIRYAEFRLKVLQVPLQYTEE